jgi:alpha-D-ribose 1-methylphosphonate 5-triphosphate diphosphatase
MNGKCIYNANIVLTDKVIFGYLAIKNSRIEAVREGSIIEKAFKKYEMQDATSMYILPGMIDMINSSIEKELETVLHDHVPFKVFFNELEKKLAFSGITTAYHCLSFGALLDHFDGSKDLDLIDEINRKKGKRHMLNHRVHLKYDVTRRDEIKKVIELIQSKYIHFLSLSNNTNINFELALAEKFANKRQRHMQINLSHMLQHAKANGVGLALHLREDLYVMPDVSYNRSLISDLEHLENVSDKLALFQPGKNILSLQSMMDKELSVDASSSILFSDAQERSLLPSIFKLGRRIDNLPQAVTMATLNPAKALGIDRYFGSIEVGKFADFVIVEIYENIPLVKETYLNGRRVIACEYFE